MVQLLRPPHLASATLLADPPWCDGPDAHDELQRRVDSGVIAADLAPALARYIDDGFAVLPRAIPVAQCQAVWADLERCREASHPLLVSLHGRPGECLYDAAMDLRSLRFLHVDSISAAARDVVTHPRIVAFIRALHASRPMAMKVAAFPYGSRQRAHADLPFMPLRQPLRTLVAWVACEKIGPGCGNLFLVPGSHRWRAHDFGHDNVLIDGPLAGSPAVTRYEDALEAQIARQGAPVHAFTAGAGDVVLFHPALVHGGLPVLDAQATRRSLVCHYGVSDRPVEDWPWGEVVHDGDIDRVAWPHPATAPRC